MRKSKLSGFIIDCQTTDLDRSADFSGNALGMAVPEHLDIETDDIEAEVRRLEGLGARRIDAVRTWVVMEAPTGQRFCVVRAISADFDTKATAWL